MYDMEKVNEVLDERMKPIEWARECRDIEYDIDNVYNREKAAKMIADAVRKNQKILVYGDVDTDGIGAAYVMCKFLWRAYKKKAMYAINKKREHGITPEMADAINTQAKGCLCIIVDSSSSMINEIKELDCDVVVLDHHKIEAGININELEGNTNTGYKYLIASNMILDLEKIERGKKVDENMSGCMVVYSVCQLLARETIGTQGLRETKLGQWVGITLLSDVITCDNNRNQFFLKRLYTEQREQTIETIFKALKGWRFDKNFINYVFVPLINSTVRMGESEKALYCIMEKPELIYKLKDNKTKQNEIVDKVIAENKDAIRERDRFVLLHTKVGSEFNGLIAAKLSSMYGKNAIAYNEVEDGKMRGSFRGDGQLDYLEMFNRVGAKAAGHSQACGIEITEAQFELAEEFMNTIPREKKVVLDMDFNRKDSEYVIGDWLKFRQLGNLYKLGDINEHSSSKEEINIRIMGQPELQEKIGEMYIYKLGEVEGIKGFTSGLLYSEHEVYVEFTDEISMYLKS